ncbi:Transcriptional regulator, XRE family protein [Enhygromyxa salina]|uniref:Transcriptional regulator, XRE family protein n=2 Tax=Enhygromyxa salina TaxID=215803 RepID=A0A0C2D681_9BACT|nr:Transcriptional regulator, XRE family protein [Enhygromyxa salina]
MTPNFFYTDLPGEFYEEEVHFRHRNRMAVAEKNKALAHSTLFAEFVDFLDRHLDLPPDNVPTRAVNAVEDIERAAEACRMKWGLGLDRPIDNMIRSLENAGVMVLMVEGYVAKVDAFSAIGPTGRKLVVLNRKDSGSRTVFNAAHELGHLVIHEGVETGDRETERQADRFASAYLMPRAGFVKEFPRTSRINWTALLKLKARWRVSLQAMVRRAYDLALISAVQYQRFYKAISAKGWRKAEPGEFPITGPEVVHAALAVLQTRMNLGFDDLASTLSVSRQKLSEITGIDAPDGQPPDEPGKVVSFVAAKEARRRA